MLNIKNLEIGMVVKNYKEMCKLLGCEEKGGRSRKLQLKNWERYFSYHREKQKLVVDEIYEIPKEKVDDRTNGNNSIYSKQVQLLILDLLVQKMENELDNDRRIYLSRGRLLSALNMINSNYTYCKFNKVTLAKFLQVEKEVVKDFYDLNDQNLKNVLHSAINALEGKSLIDCNIVTTVCINKKHRTATEEERELILEAEEMVLKEMGYSSKKGIYGNDMYNIFKRKTTDILLKEANISLYYKTYDIVFRPSVKQEKEKLERWLLGKDDRDNIKNDLNNSLINKYIKNAEERHNKVEKFPFGKSNDARINARASKEYIPDSTKVINTVINDKAEDITGKLIVMNYKNKKKVA